MLRDILGFIGVTALVIKGSELIMAYDADATVSGVTSVALFALAAYVAYGCVLLKSHND